MAIGRTYAAISLSPSHKRAFEPEDDFDDYAFDEPIPIPSRLFGPINPTTGEPTLFNDDALPHRPHVAYQSHSRKQSTSSLAKEPLHPLAPNPAPNRGGFSFRRFSIPSEEYIQAEEPPKKKRRSTTATIINGVVETVIFTGAVALTAYQLWTGRGRRGADDNVKVQVQEESDEIRQHHDDFTKLDGTHYGEGSAPSTGTTPPPPYEERWGMVNGIDFEVRSRDIITQLATIVLEGVFGILYSLYAVLFNRQSSPTPPTFLSPSILSPFPDRPFRYYSFLSPPPTPTSSTDSMAHYQPESPTLDHSNLPSPTGFPNRPLFSGLPTTLAPQRHTTYPLAGARPYHRARGPHSYASRPTRLHSRVTIRKRRSIAEPSLPSGVTAEMSPSVKKEQVTKKILPIPNPREAEDKALSRMEEKLSSLIAAGRAALHTKVEVEFDEEGEEEDAYVCSEDEA
ncbi:hypothetical protein BC937DRAFT_95144 [Endogone sp. FLAS-F59071]|nr:hypothetical protein BC937DRAFT_95144 [Endogone sp. FLAS-F59071]|eukprot:RUS13549.1 hypothetical protein BC937DRAFT_95144 [Endogone sp. FLAS-F59071]